LEVIYTVVQVTLQLTVCQSVRLDDEPLLGLMARC